MGEHRVFEDLELEYAAFDRTLDGLDEDGWSGPTLCEAWDVRDLVCHLWLQAEAARASAADEPSFLDTRPSEIDAFAAWIEEGVRRHDDVPGPEVWRRWRERRAEAIALLRSLPDGAQVMWTLGSLSPAMMGTVLTMETWTHHYDVRIPHDLPYEPTPAIRDVAFMAWKTLPWAVGLIDEEPRPVRFELDAPDGSRWSFGPDDAEGVIRGDAVELCLVAVQRTPLAEAATLRTEGTAAEVALRALRCFP